MKEGEEEMTTVHCAKIDTGAGILTVSIRGAVGAAILATVPDQGEAVRIEFIAVTGRLYCYSFLTLAKFFGSIEDFRITEHPAAPQDPTPAGPPRRARWFLRWRGRGGRRP